MYNGQSWSNARKSVQDSTAHLWHRMLAFTGFLRFDLSRHISVVIVGDILIALLSYLLAFLIRSWLSLPLTREVMPLERLFQVKHYWSVLVASQVVLLFLWDTYHDIPLKGIREVTRSAAAASGIQAMLLTSIYFFTGNLLFPRTVLPIYWVLNTAGIMTWRMVIQRALPRKRRRTLLVGSGKAAAHLIAELNRRPHIGMDIVGLISDSVPEGTKIHDRRVLGSHGRIKDLAREWDIHEVVLTPDGAWHDQFLDVISQLEASDARVTVVPSVYEILIGGVKHFNVQDIPLIEVVRDPNDPVRVLLRRVRDVLASLVFLILTAPLWIVVAAIIRLSDGGRVIYSQERVGQRGQIFRLYKFRSMHEGAEEDTGAVLAKEDDPRLTRFGRWLRRYRLDELPQVLNVLKGDMSLVGPRPERPEFVRSFNESIHGYNERHKVKPGITGLAQIWADYYSEPEIKLKYDLAYIYNCSFWLDFVILIETIRIVLGKKGV